MRRLKCRLRRAFWSPFSLRVSHLIASRTPPRFFFYDREGEQRLLVLLFIFLPELKSLHFRERYFWYVRQHLTHVMMARFIFVFESYSKQFDGIRSESKRIGDGIAHCRIVTSRRLLNVISSTATTTSTT